MADEKSSKGDSGKGIPATAEGKTTETRTWDPRLFPGGSPDAAKLRVGVTGVDKDGRWIADALVGGTKSTS